VDTAINWTTAAKGIGLGFLLSAVNPRNLLMAVSAASSCSAALPTGSTLVALLIFTVIADCSASEPVTRYLASEAMTRPLELLRTWLLCRNAAVLAVVRLVIGVTVIGKGIDRPGHTGTLTPGTGPEFQTARCLR